MSSTREKITSELADSPYASVDSVWLPVSMAEKLMVTGLVVPIISNVP